MSREDGEPAAAFLARILASGASAASAASSASGPAGLPLDRPVLAALYRGDLELADGSTCYALFREQAGATISASSLIAP